MADQKHLVVIDANSVIHRAYHALPALSTKKGEVLGAVYGFLLVFLRAIKEFQPDYVVAAFDTPKPTFRHKKYKEYKAKRPPMPEELQDQIPKVKEVLKAFSVLVLEKDGFEADDIIGTVARLAPKKQALPRIQTVILSGDLDLLQLVDKNTQVYVLRKGVKDIVLYDKDLVKERFQGLTPEQLLDYKALRGDPSDGIPGVTGIGEKTAIDLLLEFGTLEKLYQAIEKKTKKAVKLKPKLKETLIQYKEQAFLSRDLAQIEKQTPIDFNLKDSLFGKYDKKAVVKLLEKFEFQSLIKRLPKEKEPIGENLKLW